MAAIRANLQRELFQPDDERLIALINVIKTGRKKRKKGPTFLCLAATISQPVTVRLYRVKSEKGGNFRKKESWLLRDVRQVDGVHPRKQIAELELLIDKLYRWTVTNVADKDIFIRQLWKLSNRYLPVQKPDFVNVPIPIEEPSLTIAMGVNDDESAQSDEGFSRYQPVSQKEETDFRRLMLLGACSLAQTDRFSEQLALQLAHLDGANIQAIMGSEQAVTELMSVVETALEETDRLEAQLIAFDDLLLHVRDNVEMMEEKDSLGHVEMNNRHKLADHLTRTIGAVDLAQDDVQVLTDGQLSDPRSIDRCTRAAHALQYCLNSNPAPLGMDRMAFYLDQTALCRRLSDNFAEKLTAHLTALFQNLVELNSSADDQCRGLTLSKHWQRHHALMPFSELILWLKRSSLEGYRLVVDRYVSYTRELYVGDLDHFFGTAGAECQSEGDIFLHCAKRHASTQYVKRTHPPHVTFNSCIVGDQTDDQSAFIKLVNTVLSEVESVVNAEQKLCVRLFHMSADSLVAVDTQSMASEDSVEFGRQTFRNKDRQFHAQIRSVVGRIFDQLDSQLGQFAQSCERDNPFLLMTFLVELSTQVLSVRDTSSYIAVILGTLVVIVKRKFDMFMVGQIVRLNANVCHKEHETRTMDDVRVPKKTRIGVLDSIRRFRTVASVAEKAWKECERRADLDRWYPQLVNSIVQGVNKAADDSNSKSPSAVVRFENFHQLHSDICELKIGCLETIRKALRKTYQENMDIYVKNNIGRPIERLQNFFDQVERAIQQGVKVEEVGYQQQFSRLELRRIIGGYSGKEVRKGLEQLYRLVEKHLVDGSPLVQVVWRNMQVAMSAIDEFLQQLKHFDQLMGRCYPNAKIGLEFSIQDVLQYFSEIAQLH